MWLASHSTEPHHLGAAVSVACFNKREITFALRAREGKALPAVLKFALSFEFRRICVVKLRFYFFRFKLAEWEMNDSRL